MADDVWDTFKVIGDIADKVVGAVPQIVACPNCRQKNRVHWARTLVRQARCAKCGTPIAEPPKR